MKIIYLEDTSKNIEKILNEIDYINFFKENKLVLLSRHPYYVDPYIQNPYFFEKIKKLNINNSIMYIALGNLAYVFEENEMKQLNYGPKFDEIDLVEFPIKYYQEIERRKVDAISFSYSDYFQLPHFNEQRLNNYLNSIGISNNTLLEFQNINLEKDSILEIADTKERKVVFVSAENIFYGDGTSLKNIEEVLLEYLNEGNFLVLLTYTGNHYGYPFSIDKVDILDTNNYIYEYRRMLNFFNRLKIERDQVSNFKISYTGLNFEGDSYNFGFSRNNINDFFKIYLNYLRSKGYIIANVYLLEQNMDIFKSINNEYIIDFVTSQNDFKRILKKKIMKQDKKK